MTNENETRLRKTADILASLPEIPHTGTYKGVEPKASALSPYIPKRAEITGIAVVTKKAEEVKKQE